MTPRELTELRARLGWERTRLARRLAISPSRLADFERGHGRGRNARPAPIPELVALACRWLEAHEAEKRVLTPGERAALWRDDTQWPLVDRVVDDSRDGLYGYSPGGREL